MVKSYKYDAFEVARRFNGVPMCGHMKPCAILKDKQECEATYMDCSPEGCPFYQVPHEIVSSQEKAVQRLKSLPAEEQVKIAEKYHEGILEWWNLHERRVAHG